MSFDVYEYTVFFAVFVCYPLPCQLQYDSLYLF